MAIDKDVEFMRYNQVWVYLIKRHKVVGRKWFSYLSIRLILHLKDLNLRITAYGCKDHFFSHWGIE